MNVWIISLILSAILKIYIYLLLSYLIFYIGQFFEGFCYSHSGMYECYFIFVTNHDEWLLVLCTFFSCPLRHFSGQDQSYKSFFRHDISLKDKRPLV
jgi:hypothetical protein